MIVSMNPIYFCNLPAVRRVVTVVKRNVMLFAILRSIRKFWTRNRLGDSMRDRYNLNNLPFGATEDLFDGLFCSFAINYCGISF